MLPYWLARPQSINRFQSFAATILRSGSEQSRRLLFTHLSHFDYFDSFLFGVLKVHCKPERSVWAIKMGAVSLSKIYSLVSECIVAPLLWANTVQLWLQERLNQTLAGRHLGWVWYEDLFTFYFSVFFFWSHPVFKVFSLRSVAQWFLGLFNLNITFIICPASWSCFVYFTSSFSLWLTLAPPPPSGGYSQYSL